MKKCSIFFSLVLCFTQLFSTSVYASSAADVVINEIAWAGTSDSSSDEWIELYNTTNQVIDLTNWTIEDDGSPLLIESGTIAPHSYFLIEDSEISTNTPADGIIPLSLSNTGDSLTLKDDSGTTIDTANPQGTIWPAGSSTEKSSMERIDPSISSEDNWASAQSSNNALARLSSTILGTPKGVNSVYQGAGSNVSIYPESTFSLSGDTVSFTINIEDSSDLFAYGFDLNYDPSVLTFNSASEGTFLNSDSASTAFFTSLENNIEGRLMIAGSRLTNPVTGVSGSGDLLVLTFNTVGPEASSTDLSFSGTSFVSDIYGNIPASLSHASITVGQASSDPAENLQITSATDDYTLELNWEAPADGADIYIINRMQPDASFTQIAQTEELFYLDNINIIPNTTYTYQLIAVKNNISSPPLSGSASDPRGLKGDIDRNGRVDGKDIELLARSFSETLGSSNYNPLADTTFDGQVDGSDLIDLGANFGLSQ